MGSTASVGSSDDCERALAFVLVQQLGGAPEDEGRRLLVEPGLVVGRDNPLFDGRYPTLSGVTRPSPSTGIAYTRRSRQQARHVHPRPPGGASHGGAGHVNELGGVGFVVCRAPRLFVPAPHPRFAYASHAFAAAVEAVSAARQSRQPVVLVGEPGVGKSALAEDLCVGDGGSALVADLGPLVGASRRAAGGRARRQSAG